MWTDHRETAGASNPSFPWTTGRRPREDRRTTGGSTRRTCRVGRAGVAAARSGRSPGPSRPAVPVPSRRQRLPAVGRDAGPGGGQGRLTAGTTVEGCRPCSSASATVPTPSCSSSTAWTSGSAMPRTSACTTRSATGSGRAPRSLFPRPGPASRPAASEATTSGVSLTLNAEYDRYRWGPLTQAPSLLDGDGGFPRTLTDLWDHADLDEVRRECRAQLERAVLWGFDISHLDSRLDALLMRPEFFDVYLELAVDFSLPLGLLSAAAEPNVGFPVRQLAAESGILFADRFVTLPAPASRQTLADLLASLPSGLTELALHPAIDTPELRAITVEWPSRVADHELAVGEPGPRPAGGRRRGDPHRLPAPPRRHAPGLIASPNPIVWVAVRHPPLPDPSPTVDWSGTVGSTARRYPESAMTTDALEGDRSATGSAEPSSRPAAVTRPADGGRRPRQGFGREVLRAPGAGLARLGRQPPGGRPWPALW